MNKQDKIKLIMDHIRTIEKTSLKLGGFDELDQTEIEFLHNELLQHVSHVGLDKFIAMLQGIIDNIRCETDD